MNALKILAEIEKTGSITSYAAKLSADSEENAKEFLYECYEQMQSNPQSFIRHYGNKIYNDIEEFVKGTQPNF